MQPQGEEFVNDTVWCRAGGALGAAAYALLAVYLRGGEEEPADPRDRRRQE